METKGFEPYKIAYYAILVGVISKVILTATFGLNQTNYVHPTFTSCICFHFSRTPGKHLTVSKPIPQHLLFCLCLLYYNSFTVYPVKRFIIFKKGVLIFHRVRITIRQFCSQGLFFNPIQLRWWTPNFNYRTVCTKGSVYLCRQNQLRTLLIDLHF